MIYEECKKKELGGDLPSEWFGADLSERMDKRLHAFAIIIARQSRNQKESEYLAQRRKGAKEKHCHFERREKPLAVSSSTWREQMSVPGGRWVVEKFLQAEKNFQP